MPSLQVRVAIEITLGSRSASLVGSQTRAMADGRPSQKVEPVCGGLSCGGSVW